MSSPRPRQATTSRRLVATLLAVMAITGLGSMPAEAAVPAGSGGLPTTTLAPTSWGALPVAAALRADTLAPADRAILRMLPDGTRVAMHAQTGRVRFLAGSARRPLATASSLAVLAGRPARGSNSAGGTAAEVAVTAARIFLGATAALFGLSGADRDLQLERSQTAGSGRTFVRFQQLRDGLPVLGGELIVQVDRRGGIISTSGEALPAGDVVSTRPRLAAAAARTAAAALVAREAAATSATSTSSSAATSDRQAVAVAGAAVAGAVVTDLMGLAILDPRLMGGGGPPMPRLVWQVDARLEVASAPQPTHRLVFVDALNGAVLDSVSRVEGDLARVVCDAHEKPNADFRCRPPYARSEGQPATHKQQVDSVYALMGLTYDFYRTRFGRDSLDGGGEPMVATVDYCPLFSCPFQNSFWEWGPQQTAFGLGWASADDIVAHEFTHGVQDHEDRLFYHYQSGAINESFADIFGEFVDLSDGYGNDTAGVRWLIGEDMPTGALRSMSDPGRFGDPDRVRSPRWSASTADEGGVHTNSGVGNKAAALIADGGSFNGHVVAGLGLARAEAIEYETMTNLITSAADYNDLYDALQQGCLDLVGTQGIRYADCRSVHEAVAATEMDLLPRAEQPRVAPTCRSGSYPVDVFADDFEDPSRGAWTSSAVSGSLDAWYYPPNPNNSLKWDGTWASSGALNIYGSDQAGVTDSAMAMTAPVRLPAGAFLRFEQGFRFDSGSAGRFDGGVVELSVDGGRWKDAGSYFRDEGYNGRLARHHGNPLAGRRAFSGDSFGWGASRLDLSSLAGHKVRVRFRLGTDASTGSYGWYIDDVRIYRCAADHTRPTGSLTLAGGAGTTRDATVGVALTGSDGGSGLSRMRISDSGVLSHGVLRSGLEMPWARTVPGWLLTDRRWGGHSGDGAHHVYAQFQDAAGNWSRVIRDSIVLDATAPVVSPPDVRFVPGSQIARSGPPVPLRATFSATDATSGVAATDLQRRTGGGPWSAVDTGSAVGTSATLLLADDPSTTQQLRARARDAAGSWSPEHPGGTFTIEPLQEDASAWSYASAWHVAVDASAYGGATRWANTAGALATLEFTGTDVALIAVRGPDRGVANVSIDGTLVQTLDLGASHSLPRDIVFAAHVAAGPHVLQVRVSGSNGPASTGNRVDIDAAVVLAQ